MTTIETEEYVQSIMDSLVIQAAVLGLLALLLAFTFSASMSRFDTRKQLVVEEANAIGTTFFPAHMLPKPSYTEVCNLLRRYVDVRLNFYRAGIDQKGLRKAKGHLGTTPK